jgi:hypothetical protein
VTIKRIIWLIAIAPMSPAQKREFAANASNITGVWKKCPPAFSRIMWKEPTIDQLKDLFKYMENSL